MQRILRFIGFSGLMTAAALLSPQSYAAPQESGLMTVAMQKHTAGTFYIEGAIEGYGEMQMLVDTGSSFLVISQNMLEKLKESGDAAYSHDLNGSMADGSRRVIPVYRLAGIRLGKSCWIHDVEAAVFPAGARPILGMNVLSRLAPFTFSAEPPALGVNQCQQPATPVEDFAALQKDAPAPAESTPAPTGISQ